MPSTSDLRRTPTHVRRNPWKLARQVERDYLFRSIRTESYNLDDPELLAMQAILSALQPLDVGAQKRVIGWAANRLGISTTSPLSGTEHVAPASSHVETVAPAQTNNGATADLDTLADLFNSASPKTQSESALVVGYWLQTHEAMADFDSLRINKELKNLGHGIPNITRALDDLKSQKPALAIQLRKSGSAKQARKKYKITDAGIKSVQRMLKGDE